MTMPSFEPVAWYKQSEFDDSKRKSQSFNGWTKQYSDLNSGLFTAEQLQQAYEAGKRDAAPQVEHEPIGYQQIFDAIAKATWVAASPGINISVEAFTKSIGPLYAAPPAPAVPDGWADLANDLLMFFESPMHEFSAEQEQRLRSRLHAYLASPEPTK